MSRPASGLLALLVLATPAAAQDRRPISLEDHYRIEDVGQVALSPDGGRIAWVRTVALEEENRDHSEIWLVGWDGSGAMRLTSPATNASGPRWSPDGTLLAFSSRRAVAGDDDPGATWFLRMDAPGEAFRIPGVAGTPLFDPTNRWIAFTRPVPPDGSRPEPEPPGTEAERRIVERFDGRAYEWMQYRFDGRGYLPDPRDPWATPPEQLFVVARGGGRPRRLTDLDVDVRGAAWRPDGDALAFVADAHERDEHSYERADLWTVTLEGTVTRLTDDEHDYGAPAWSPDGGSLVVTGNLGLDVVIRERRDRGAPEDLFVFAADGSGRRNVTAEWDLIPGAPTWSPDGRWIYFAAGVGGATHLFRVSPEGGAVEQVTRGERRLGSVSFSADMGRAAYVARNPVDPGNVLSLSPVDPEGTERRVTDLNAALLSELDLRAPERIEYRSPDGTPVEGWLLPPVGYPESEGRRWPLILNIHGGPHGAYGWEFSFDRHLQSAAGYFVLYTNPRGSTGYGEAFRWGTWGSWGDEDYDDVMAGVDHVVGRWPVDTTRMGVTGYSYGGYLTNWIITQTDRFAAALSGAGISNWVSDYGTADIPRTKESEFFGPPWEEEGLKNLLQASPIVHAKGVSTPTLFVNGESDHRVPIEEAEQMYTALRKQRVPARMIRYPDSYHGGWTHWRYLHRLYSALEWWERWLGEKPIS
ncbi:MAG TPA: S9 family peptidase [Longimicrobiales bacterium]|nr:S9 family peptidase [Longimicrobiales bacterium]